MRPSEDFRLRRAEASAHLLARADRSAHHPHDPRSDDPGPAPGQLYSLDAGRDSGIEWLLLGVAADGRHVLAPVDGMGMAGSGDVVLDPAGPAGAGTVRATRAVRVRIDLDRHRPSGAISPDDLEKVRLFRGAAPRPAVEEEALEDPDYRRWLTEHLRPALTALEAETAPRSGRWRGSWLAAAAALFVGLGLGWWLPDPGSGARQDAALVWFPPATDPLRGEEREIAVSASASELVLVFETLADRAYETYRLELHGDRGMFWSRDALPLQGASEVVVIIPKGVLPEATVTARLFGQIPQRDPVPLESWSFRIVENPAGRDPL